MLLGTLMPCQAAFGCNSCAHLYAIHLTINVQPFIHTTFQFIALQPIVVTMIPRGHHAPAYSPIGQTLLRVPLQGVSLLHGLPWFTNCIESRFYAVPFKFKFNQLLIFIEKFSPLPGFEPGISPVPSRYATNWAILALIITGNVTNTKLVPNSFKTSGHDRFLEVGINRQSPIFSLVTRNTF